MGSDYHTKGSDISAKDTTTDRVATDQPLGPDGEQEDLSVSINDFDNEDPYSSDEAESAWDQRSHLPDEDDEPQSPYDTAIDGASPTVSDYQNEPVEVPDFEDESAQEPEGATIGDTASVDSSISELVSEEPNQLQGTVTAESAPEPTTPPEARSVEVEDTDGLYEKYNKPSESTDPLGPQPLDDDQATTPSIDEQLKTLDTESLSATERQILAKSVKNGVHPELVDSDTAGLQSLSTDERQQVFDQVTDTETATSLAAGAEQTLPNQPEGIDLEGVNGDTAYNMSSSEIDRDPASLPANQFDSPGGGYGNTAGNADVARLQQMAIDAVPEGADLEHGSARNRGVHADHENSLNLQTAGGDNATPLGGTPNDPNADPGGGTKDANGEWAPKSITEMREESAAQELERQEQTIAQKLRYGEYDSGESEWVFDDSAGEQETIRAQATSTNVSRETEFKGWDPEVELARDNLRHEQASSPDEFEELDGIDPMERARAARQANSSDIEPGKIPVGYQEHRYKEGKEKHGRQSRADVAYESVPDNLKTHVDSFASELSQKTALGETEARNHVMLKLEEETGTIGSTPEKLNEELESIRPHQWEEVSNKAKADAMVSNDIINDHKNRNRKNTRLDRTNQAVSLHDLEDVASVADVGRNNSGWSGYNGLLQQADVKDLHVSGTVEGENLQYSNSPAQVVYASPADNPARDKQVKISIWDSAEDTTEDAASPNHETDQSGRLISQTKNLPNLESGDIFNIESADLRTYEDSNGDIQLSMSLGRESEVEVTGSTFSSGADRGGNEGTSNTGSASEATSGSSGSGSNPLDSLVTGEKERVSLKKHNGRMSTNSTSDDDGSEKNVSDMVTELQDMKWQ